MAEERRVALVTGAGHGIGAATALRLFHDGWRVVVADIDSAPADQVAKAASGLSVVCDVASENDVQRLVAESLSRFGRIDAIVSNAGINVRGSLSEIDLATWNRVLAVNLTAAFLLARAAERPLRAAKGAMVLIASTRAHMSEPDTLPYSASKGGLVALTHALAMTFAPDVRVNCISPGWIDTGKYGPLRPEDHAQHPAGRVGQTGDIAAAVSYLLSEDAGFITGAELIVDGGMTRKMIYV
jgi:NAD(P)-dependent dehydrogenase (short-subunit alcohol dehydrogenase family)